MRLANKIGIVTGAGRGMGRAGVLRFLAEGAQVLAVDVDAGALDELRAAAPAPGRLALLTGDLRSVEFARSLATHAVEVFGGLDFLWNHVGFPGTGGFEDLDMETYDAIFDLTLRAGVAASQAAIPHLRARGGGALLFTSSTSGLRASARAPMYSVAKHAVTALVKVLARRYGPEKIRVNAVCPGPISGTHSLRNFMSRFPGEPEAESRVADMAAEVPLGRTGTADDVAAAALFLLSDEASFISGAALPVDGAMTA